MPTSGTGRFTRKHWVILVLSLIPLAALPWTVDYWPGQDDPNHLALTHIVQQFNEPGSPFPDYFTVNRDLSPYKLYYFLLIFLSRFMEIDAANRVVVSTVILGLPLVMLFWLRRFAPDRQTHVFLVCLLATTLLPLIGFHAYMLSLIFGIAALAMASGKPDAEGLRQPAGWGGLLAASVLLFIGAIAHPVAPVIIGAILFFIEAPGRKLVPWLRLAVVGTPAVILLGATSLASPPNDNLAAFAPNFPGILPNIRVLLSNVIAFDRTEFLIRLPVLIALLSAGILALRGIGIRGQGRDQCLARVFVVMLVALFTLPNFPALNFLPERFAFLALLIAAMLPLPSWIARRPRALLGFTLVASLTLFFVQHRAAKSLSSEVAKVVEAGQDLPRGTKVLPLMFGSPEHGDKINPLRHAWGHLVLEKDIVTPYLFANSSGFTIAGGGWRPVTYRDPFGPDNMLYMQEGLPDTMVKYERFISESALRLMKELILETMASYDRAILVLPPEDFVEEAMESMETVRRVDKVWVLKPRGDSTPDAEPEDEP
ncbi:hypothetical protein [Haloferula sp. A504]|uniref:hypothetical protein n=1 Tax=Haloferula sp. A504 TaxID=3373601 RepID=UPI0031C7B76C|nr:hypothetical protein [Verrucomicrobiaceae bacterium E54]